MTNSKAGTITRAIILTLAVLSAAQLVSAQGIGIDWRPTLNLSNSPPSSKQPTLASDPAGNVHVVWAEDMGGPSLLDNPDAGLSAANTLVYTRWNGSTWSDPIDIIALSGDNFAEYPSLAADSRGFLHLVWTGMSRIYYSRAAALEAGSPHAWSSPVTVGGSARTSWESAVAVDAQGTAHILYANRESDPAVMHARVSETGLEEMASTRLSEPLSRDEAAFYKVSLKIDPKDRIHALWGTVQADGIGQAVYYARSLDGGQTWSEAVRLAEAREAKTLVEGASLGIAGDSELHLIYAYPANMGRTERISTDGGETWGEPHTIYEDLEGISGLSHLLTDAAGSLHAVSILRTHDQVGGLFYWRWLGDHWSPWQLASLTTDTEGPGGEFPAATMRLGNEIHAAWISTATKLSGEIWHVSGTIPDVAALAPASLPTTTPQQQEQPGSSPNTQLAQTPPSIVASSNNAPEAANTPTDTAIAQPLDTSLALLIGLAPALLLVLSVVLWRLIRKH